MESSEEFRGMSLLGITNQLLESERTIDEVYKRALRMVEDPQVINCLAQARLRHLEDILSFKQAALLLGGEPSNGFDTGLSASKALELEGDDLLEVRLLEALLSLEQRRRGRLNSARDFFAERRETHAVFEDQLIPRANALESSLSYAIAQLKRELRTTQSGKEIANTAKKRLFGGDDVAASPAR